MLNNEPSLLAIAQHNTVIWSSQLLGYFSAFTHFGIHLHVSLSNPLWDTALMH